MPVSTAPPVEEDEQDEWHYELVPAHALPTVDLSVSVMSVLAGSEVDAKFFAVMRRHYGKLVKLFRISTLCMVSTFVAPASTGYILTGVTMCLSLGSFTCSILMMSWQLLHHSLSMQEVRFMSIMNWLNWMTLAILFSDFRSFVCVLQAWAIQLSILSDAMFRTVLSATKSSVLALPLLVVCVLIVFLRLADVPSANYATVRVNNIEIELVDVFLNLSTTLSVLVGRNVFRQRRAIAGAATKLIPSATLKAKLMLKPALRSRLATRVPRLTAIHGRPPQISEGQSDPDPYPDPDMASSRVSPELLAPPLALSSSDPVYLQRIQSAQPRPEQMRGPEASLTLPPSQLQRLPVSIRQDPSDCTISAATSVSTLGGRPQPVYPRARTPRRLRRARAAAAGYAHRLSALSYTIRSALLTKAYDRTAPHLQQLRLVPSRLKFVDSRKTLVPSLTLTTELSNLHVRLLGISGLSGVILVVISAMLLDRPDAVSIGIQRALHLLSLSLTLPVVLMSLASTQRTLLRVLAHNFDALFNFFQFLVSALCLCAMVRWDERCLVLLTLGLWFTWIVTFDAITPRIRGRLGVKKHHAGVVHLAIMISLLSVVCSLVFDDRNCYADSRIARIDFTAGAKMEIRIKSVYLNRMFPLTIWGLRLLWDLLVCPEEELIFIKGFMEYFCPLEMLPLPKAGQIVPTD